MFVLPLASIAGNPNLPIPRRHAVCSQPRTLFVADGCCAQSAELVARCDQAKQGCDEKLLHPVQHDRLSIHKLSHGAFGGAFDSAHLPGIAFGAFISRLARCPVTLPHSSFKRLLRSGLECFDFTDNFNVVSVVKRHDLTDPVGPYVPMGEFAPFIAKHASTGGLSHDGTRPIPAQSLR